MIPLRSAVCVVALVISLAPVSSAFAVDQSIEHLQAELANAKAQKEIAVDESNEIMQDGQLSAANERMIALLDSEAFRLRQLDLVANASAIEDISRALANAMRMSGDANAKNELLIAQFRASVLLAKAEADMANAIAQNRPSEIANAKAQGMLFREAASLISGTLAETNMSSAKIRGERQADVVHTPALNELSNGRAMGANELLAADASLAAGELAAFSSIESSEEDMSEVIQHADASLANAFAQLADATDGDEE
jgi:hypothetical protein